MRLASFVISFCLHAGFVLLVLFWPTPPPHTREPQAMTVSLVEGLPGGNRTPEPILTREASARTQPPPSAPSKEIPRPVPQEPPQEAVPVPIETASPPKMIAPEPVRRPPPEKEVKPEAPKEADKQPETKQPETKQPETRKSETPKDPVKAALEKARAASSPPPAEPKTKPNAVTQALAAARTQSGGSSGEGEGGGGIGDVYAAQIVMAVRPNWHWPAQARGGLSVALYLKIDAVGRVLDVRVDGSSGDPIFDSSAVSAVRVTQVLPPPPSPAYREIILRFFPIQ